MRSEPSAAISSAFSIEALTRGAAARSPAELLISELRLEQSDQFLICTSTKYLTKVGDAQMTTCDVLKLAALVFRTAHRKFEGYPRLNQDDNI